MCIFQKYLDKLHSIFIQLQSFHQIYAHFHSTFDVRICLDNKYFKHVLVKTLTLLCLMEIKK